MNNGLTDFHIPAPAYEIIRELKEIEGRYNFLSEWITEIDAHVKQAARRFTGLELDDPVKGQRRLRIVETATYVKREMSYAKLEAAISPATFARLIEKTPPAFPRTVTLNSHHRGPCSEWIAMEKIGAAAQLSTYAPNMRRDWKAMTPQQIAAGLNGLKGAKADFGKQSKQLRGVLAAMAEESHWETGLFGKSDGRLRLSKAAPKYTVIGGDEAREALLRRYPIFVRTVRMPATSVVRFVNAGQLNT